MASVLLSESKKSTEHRCYNLALQITTSWPRQIRFRGRCATGDDTTFDEEILEDGLRLSLIGMGVVFAVLTLLAVSIKVFERIDSLIPEEGAAGTPEIDSNQAVTAPAVSATPASSENGDAKAAAAIAVALALAEADRDNSSTGLTGGLSRASANIWVAAGRTREMANRFTGQSFRTRSGR